MPSCCFAFAAMQRRSYNQEEGERLKILNCLILAVDNILMTFINFVIFLIVDEHRRGC